jgi:hypothetical protein
MGLFERAMKWIAGTEAAAPAKRPGRNEPCWCGSGEKYKRCHLHEDEKKVADACSINCGST